jgi:hypothetical protein
MKARRVRTLIWFGDEQGGGAVGLLQSNLLRTLTLGHGPETMFTTFNPFYPPALAQYEQRGASPIGRTRRGWTSLRPRAHLACSVTFCCSAALLGLRLACAAFN